jgi:signal transduction histidine kinase
MVGELEASAPDSPEVRRALEVIRRNVELEARLIDDLLDVTRISKGKLQLSLETVSIHEILQRAYEICREEIVAKNLRMEFRSALSPSTWKAIPRVCSRSFGILSRTA